MKHIKKNILTLLLTGLILGSLVGCGAGGTSSTAPQSSTVPGSTSTADSSGIAELNGYLTEGPIPDNFQYKDRLYIGGENNYYLIDIEGNLVRWGTNWDNWDMGWEQGGSTDVTLQAFNQRNALVQHAVKYVRSFSASFVLDENHNLWAWSAANAWPLMDSEGDKPFNEPRIIMSSVRDIAASDLDMAVVMEDGTLKLWGSDKDLQKPRDICKNAEKVFNTRSGYYYIDTAGNLYNMDCISPNGPGSPLRENVEPILLDTEVADIADAYDPFVGVLLVLKKNGMVELLNSQDAPPTVTLVAEHARAINGSGFISADGDYWRVSTDSGKYVGMEKEKNTVWAVYNFVGDSIRILKDGKIEVRFNKDS